MIEMQVDFDAMPTLGDIPRYHARVRPQRLSMTFEGRTISWVELDAGASRVANRLVAAGCEPGDRVAYVGKGTDEFFELMFEIAQAGANAIRLSACSCAQVTARVLLALLHPMQVRYQAAPRPDYCGC